ncbi:MAG: hypothetical protein HUU35_06350 [Armatimonadetes bacterium]|nr:hypothetical protein [Armatimonadota bacterium]
MAEELSVDQAAEDEASWCECFESLGPILACGLGIAALAGAVDLFILPAEWRPPGAGLALGLFGVFLIALAVRCGLSCSDAELHPDQ